MLVSYALFPFASGASYLMPELSTELAGATSQAGFAEIDGVGSTVTKHLRQTGTMHNLRALV
jgi:hypothetical protein